MIYLNKITDEGVDIDLDAIEQTLNLIILPTFLQSFEHIYVTVVCVATNDRTFEMKAEDGDLYITIPLDYNAIEGG